MKTKDSKDAQEKISLKDTLKVSIRSFVLTFRLVPQATLGLIFVMLVLQFTPFVQNGIFSIILNKLTSLISSTESIQDRTLIGTFLTLILFYVGTMTFSSIFEEIKKFVERRWDLLTDHRLGNYSTRKRSEIDMARYEDPDFQNLMYRAFEHNTWPIYSLAKGQIQNIVSLIGVMTAGLIVYNINSSLFYISLIASIPSFIVELKYGSTMWGIWTENSPRQRLYFALRSHIHRRENVIQTKMLQASKRILSTIESIMFNFMKDQLSADKSKLYLGIGANALMSLGIGYGFYLIVQDVLVGNIQIGTLVFAVTSLQSLVFTINITLRDIAEQYRRALRAKDIFTVYDTPPFIVDTKSPTRVDFTKPPHIEFKNVSFKYPSKKSEDAPWVFKDLNFTISPGEKIGLVGQNGAGKSTLIKILMRVYDPTEGQILINGVDLKNIKLDDWTSTLSVLLQQYSLHEFSVEEAIAMGAPDTELDTELVRHASKMSGADEFIQEYPKKYQQQVSREFDDGIEPSQGQLQKIALARSLYRLKIGQVLVLDEPTAAIDPIAEQEIFEQMEKATEGKTLILITHRFNSVKNVDRILVLDGHHLVEQGSHSELMKKKGLYSQMFESQAKGFIEGSKNTNNSEETLDELLAKVTP